MQRAMWVQEAYKLDFINDMADSIERAYRPCRRYRERLFFYGLLCWFPASHYLSGGNVRCLYGTDKTGNQQSTSRCYQLCGGVRAVRFIYCLCSRLYQEDNEFSSDISTASLDLGTKIMLPNSDSEGKDSVDLIRDSLFSIQVEQPWLLLQFGNSNAEESDRPCRSSRIGKSRGRGRENQRGSRENRNRGQRQ